MTKPGFGHYLVLSEQEENKLVKLISKKKVSLRIILMRGVKAILSDMKEDVSTAS